MAAPTSSTAAPGPAMLAAPNLETVAGVDVGGGLLNVELDTGYVAVGEYVMTCELGLTKVAVGYDEPGPSD